MCCRRSAATSCRSRPTGPHTRPSPGTGPRPPRARVRRRHSPGSSTAEHRRSTSASGACGARTPRSRHDSRRAARRTATRDLSLHRRPAVLVRADAGSRGLPGPRPTAATHRRTPHRGSRGDGIGRLDVPQGHRARRAGAIRGRNTPCSRTPARAHHPPAHALGLSDRDTRPGCGRGRDRPDVPPPLGTVGWGPRTAPCQCAERQPETTYRFDHR